MFRFKLWLEVQRNVMVMVMVMVMYLCSAFSMWIYSNALYNTLWGTFAGLLHGAVHNLFLM